MVLSPGLHSFLWKDLEQYPSFKKDFLDRIREEEKSLHTIMKTSRNKTAKMRALIALSWLDGIKKKP